MQTKENTLAILKVFLYVSILFLVVHESAYAACDREDVDHYLDKGFNPEQITKICSTAAVKSTPKVTTPSTVERAELQNVGRSSLNTVGQQQQDFVFLKSAISADDIQIDESKLSFDRRECIEYNQRPTIADARKAYCGAVRTTVYFNGLELSKSKGLSLSSFFKRGLVVTGNVNKKVINSQKFSAQLTRFEQMLVLKKMQEDDVIIPVHAGVSLNKVTTIFANLAR